MESEKVKVKSEKWGCILKNEIMDVSRMSFREHWRLLGKRCIAFPSKLIGFKPFCFIVATVLLAMGLISEWVWFCVLVIVLFGIVGLKVIRNSESGIRNDNQNTEDNLGG